MLPNACIRVCVLGTLGIGFNNGRATLDWLAGQQASGALASTLESLVVMGCSAGSIGAQLWSDTTINTLKWNKVSK